MSTDSLEVSQKLSKLHAIPNSTEAADNKALFHIVRTNYAAYRAHLVQAKAIEALKIMQEIVPEGELELSLPRAGSDASGATSDDSSPRSSGSQVRPSP